MKLSENNKHINPTNEPDYLESENDSSSDEIRTLSDDFIIFWVFFSIVVIFIIIPLIYILSALILFK